MRNEEIAIQLNLLNAEAMDEAESLLEQMCVDLAKAGFGGEYIASVLHPSAHDALAHTIGAAKLLRETQGDRCAGEEARIRIATALKSHVTGEHIVAFRMWDQVLRGRGASPALLTILQYIDELGDIPAAVFPPSEPHDIPTRVHRMVKNSIERAREIGLR